ncbi:hypothetical protein B0H11DRAFT_2403767 [Mycena galericulata]|nr:hypothetical protein B0H11DRAFT_2403767 [Mycena galericulata]
MLLLLGLPRALVIFVAPEADYGELVVLNEDVERVKKATLRSKHRPVRSTLTPSASTSSCAVLARATQASRAVYTEQTRVAAFVMASASSGSTTEDEDAGHSALAFRFLGRLWRRRPRCQSGSLRRAPRPRASGTRQRLVASASHNRLSVGAHGEVQDAVGVPGERGDHVERGVLLDADLVLRGGGRKAVGRDELVRGQRPYQIAHLQQFRSSKRDAKKNLTWLPVSSSLSIVPLIVFQNRMCLSWVCVPRLGAFFRIRRQRAHGLDRLLRRDYRILVLRVRRRRDCLPAEQTLDEGVHASPRARVALPAQQAHEVRVERVEVAREEALRHGPIEVADREALRAHISSARKTSMSEVGPSLPKKNRERVLTRKMLGIWKAWYGGGVGVLALRPCYITRCPCPDGGAEFFLLAPIVILEVHAFRGHERLPLLPGVALPARAGESAEEAPDAREEDADADVDVEGKHGRGQRKRMTTLSAAVSLPAALLVNILLNGELDGEEQGLCATENVNARGTGEMIIKGGSSAPVLTSSDSRTPTTNTGFQSDAGE